MKRQRDEEATTNQINQPCSIQVLPVALLTIILSLIPFKEAVRTSILSKQWQYIWLSLPNFTFDDSLGHTPTTWFSNASKILRSLCCQHQTFIQSLTISTRFSNTYKPFAEFLYGLTNINIKRLNVLNINPDSNTETFIHTFCFKVPSLQFLELQQCTLIGTDFPASNITNLIIRSACIISPQFIQLISSCQCLQTLILDGIFGLDRITFPTPNKISTFKLYGRWPFSSVSIEDIQCLTSFMLDLWCLMGSKTQLITLLSNLGSVQNLHLRCLKQSHHDEEESSDVYKKAIKLPTRLSSSFLLHNLKELELGLSLSNGNLIPILTCLLNSSPNLQSLIVKDDEYRFSCETVHPEYWKRQHIPECFAHNLMFVWLRSVNLNRESTLSLIEFILNNAFALKRLTVGYRAAPRKQKSFERAMRLLQEAATNQVLHFENEISG